MYEREIVSFFPGIRSNLKVKWAVDLKSADKE